MTKSQVQAVLEKHIPQAVTYSERISDYEKEAEELHRKVITRRNKNLYKDGINFGEIE